MSRLRPLQLLEINLISAQDLAPVGRSMRTYAIAWVHPDRKLSTRIDSTGHNSPTWNDKFVFRVDDEFLRADTSAVMIDIYSQHWFRDYHVGTVRILVGNLIPPSVRPGHRTQMGMRFMALQVRRSSGRPQGLLNIGVALLDSSMRSMPLYSQLSASAVGFHDLVGEDDPKKINNNNNQNPPLEKIVLRRCKSERSDRLVSEAEFSDFPASSVNGSEVSGPRKRNKTSGKASSMISGSSAGGRSKGKMKSGKASSVISGSEFVDLLKKKSGAKASSMLNGSEVSYPVIKSKGSILSAGSTDLGEPLMKKTNGKADSLINSSEGGEFTKGKVGTKFIGFDFGSKATPKTSGLEFWGPGKGGLRSFKLNDYGGPKNITTGSMLSESEVGPSPSEVAAAIAHDRCRQAEDGNNSALDGWSLNSSEEGLRSKLQRWRTELPPLYDRGAYGIYRTPGGHVRRHTEGDEPDGSGLFSCFGNICGYECSIVCGGNPNPSSRR
ncbi:hypothetical protein VitviT2T_006807 [Vitis vinifera]|uniref:C2 domain-containing protein n=2 Tax=Vitis vinifera TaxID=29760 RepID=A0ABY9BY06_VITVI|nr:uncharacterized protein LOC100256206 [Vitis vinifera]WJZ87428.1 hypothetical protein VitviT2T_006807 [Vitis vinifera]|eukprot:XP_002282144.1 PREDICTED: uncharacterized protein LOC100256206 [Vitis vinifera]